MHNIAGALTRRKTDSPWPTDWLELFRALYRDAHDFEMRSAEQ